MTSTPTGTTPSGPCPTKHPYHHASRRHAGDTSIISSPLLSVMPSIDVARCRPAADSVRRDWPGGRRRARCPSMLRTNGPATAGWIPPGLARALCGQKSTRAGCSGVLGRAGRCGTGSDVALGGFADALQRLLHPCPQLSAAVAASVQAADDEPSQAGDGCGDVVGLGQPGAVAVGLKLVTPDEGARELFGAGEGELASRLRGDDDRAVLPRGPPGEL